MKFTDRAPIGAVKRTKEGYLVATARVAEYGSLSQQNRFAGGTEWDTV